jgi:hypothetical protein
MQIVDAQIHVWGRVLMALIVVDGMHHRDGS